MNHRYFRFFTGAIPWQAESSSSINLSCESHMIHWLNSLISSLNIFGCFCLGLVSGDESPIFQIVYGCQAIPWQSRHRQSIYHVNRSWYHSNNLETYKYAFFVNPLIVAIDDGSNLIFPSRRTHQAMRLVSPRLCLAAPTWLFRTTKQGAIEPRCSVVWRGYDGLLSSAALSAATWRRSSYLIFLLHDSHWRRNMLSGISWNSSFWGDRENISSELYNSDFCGALSLPMRVYRPCSSPTLAVCAEST
jgi:hypothetical protein